MLKKKIAVLCYENPFNKPSDGAKNDMKTSVLALSLSGKYLIDLYAFNQKKEDLAQINCEKYSILHFYQYTLPSISVAAIFSKWPLSVYRRFSMDMADELSKHEYDAIIYVGGHMASYRLKRIGNAKRHILRQHGIESVYRRELSKSAPNISYKIGQLVESHKYKVLESNIDSLFDSMLFISKSECDIFAGKFKDSLCSFKFMPPATLQFSPRIYTVRNGKELLYFGNMELHNNFLSILWFVEKVFPYIEKEQKNVSLKIIGKISEDNRKKLGKLSTNIQILGYVDDLSYEIKNAALLVLPVLYGAGVKLKVIDALAYEQIVCATSKTIEGTELRDKEHLLVEDDPLEMAKRCIEVITKRTEFFKMATCGYEFVKKFHSVEYQASILRDEIER